MGQRVELIELDSILGYVLKKAAAELRSAMDDALREFEITVPQYVCLELLARDPGLSNAELARSGFVTRQSMNVLLRGLQDRGLVTRPDRAPRGRARPTNLTPAGQDVLNSAVDAVQVVERKLVAPLTPSQANQMRGWLDACADAVSVRDSAG